MAVAVMAPLKPRKGEYQRYVSKKDQSLVTLQKHQNRVKPRKFKRKRRVPRTVPRAPFNDSSFLMRVRRAGGLAAPASVFQSPAFSNFDSVAYRDFLDHEDYGYGSMTGLIRLRDTEEGGDSAGSVVNMSAGAQNLEQRVDRFEMMNLEASQQVASKASRIRDLEDENLALKNRLFLVQQEVDELRERLRGSEHENDSPQSCLES